MSCNYADGLSPYENKGKLGLPEQWDETEDVSEKVSQLAKWIRQSRHVVVHTGAGISTSAGIPDFRGPKGVWTLEKKGLRAETGLDWDQAKPTKTHMAIAKLVEAGLVHFVVSQNIDGLHLRSGVQRSKLAELHGNMFVDQCGTCQRQFVRSSASQTVGQKVSEASCPAPKPNGRACRGRLADFVLDWEHELPDLDLDLSDAHSSIADLSLVLGSTLQIIPSGNLPTYAKKFDPAGGKLVIVNLQPTKHDKKADLLIHEYVDKVMERLCLELGLEIPQYDPHGDPVRIVIELQRKNKFQFVEWSQCPVETKRLKVLSGAVEEAFKRKRKADRENKNKRPVENDAESCSDSNTQGTDETEEKKVKLEELATFGAEETNNIDSSLGDASQNSDDGEIKLEDTEFC